MAEEALPKVRPLRPLSPRDQAFLERIEAGEEKTAREWSQELFGTEFKSQGVYATIARLRKHKYYIAPVTTTNGDKGILKLFVNEEDYSRQVTKRYDHMITGRLEVYSDFIPYVLSKHPELKENVAGLADELQHFLLVVLKAKEAITSGTYGKDSKTPPSLQDKT